MPTNYTNRERNWATPRDDTPDQVPLSANRYSAHGEKFKQWDFAPPLGSQITFKTGTV